MKHQIHGDPNRNRQQSQVDEVLPLVRNRPLREDFLKLARGHQATRERQRAEDDFQRQHRHHERGNIRGSQIELRRPNQGHAKCTESMAQRRSLRDRRHSDITEGDANDRTQNQSDRDPLVIDDAVIEQRAGNGQHHSDFACPDATSRGSWRAQPLERENEEDRRDDIGDFNEVFGR